MSWRAGQRLVRGNHSGIPRTATNGKDAIPIIFSEWKRMRKAVRVSPEAGKAPIWSETSQAAV
jgi:hypothetical protein